MAAASELAYALAEDAHDFARRLDAVMPDLAADPALRNLLGATRTMILKAETAERLIRKCGDEIDALRRTEDAVGPVSATPIHDP